ncbi:MAG: DUF2103 domain-containing protein [Patescibacteria group bacterium]
MMRYRGNSKIKKKHQILPELDAFLRKIEGWPEISAVNPGEIKLCRHNDHLRITLQGQTSVSLRCLARSHGAVQEFYLVSGDLTKLSLRLADYLDENN